MQKAKKRLFSVTAVLLAVLVALTALLPTAGAAQAATMRSKYTGKSYTHNARFDKLEVLNGVDISAWQEKVNWKKIKNVIAISTARASASSILLIISPTIHPLLTHGFFIFDKRRYACAG